MTVDTRERLAGVLRDRGQLEDAEREYREVYAARQRIQGPDHTDTLGTRERLAGVLRDRGQLEDAEREYREVYAARQRIQGPEHTMTVDTRERLAGVLRDRGQLEDAEREYREVYAARQRIQGPDHTNTLGTRGNLAAVLLERGRRVISPPMRQPATTGGINTMIDRSDAKSALEQALAHLQEALGLVDPDKEPGFYGVILHDLAVVYKAAGNLQQAGAAYQESAVYKRRRVPYDPGDLAVTMEAYSDLLLDCGELAEARTVLDQLKELLPQVKEPAQAIRLHNLGNIFERLAGSAKRTPTLKL